MLNKEGFTLAEVLITLSIIGVVAALTIPQLVKNMNDYAFGKSRDITLAKIKEATNQMKSNDALSGYASSAAFVDEFQKYMKISKRCDSTILANCFPATIKASNGQSIDTTTLTTGGKLGSNNLTGNTIALMLANGTSILFTLRDSTKVAGACDRIDPTDNQTNTTGCMSFLYDINGYGSPNVLGKDVGNVNVDISGLACPGAKVGALCVDAADLPNPLSLVPTDAAYQDLIDRGIMSGPYIDIFPTGEQGRAYDYWAGAVYACDQKGMRLPTRAEAATMLLNKGTIGGFSVFGDNRDAYYTSETMTTYHAYYQYFGLTTPWTWNLVARTTANCSARCVK